jgi:hypothetical protein
MIRKNGFKRPFHKLQVVSWVYVIILFSMFAFMVIPLLDRKPKIIVSILYALSLFLVILSGFFCTAADPTDPALKESLQATILS